MVRLDSQVHRFSLTTSVDYQTVRSVNNDMHLKSEREQGSSGKNGTFPCDLRVFASWGGGAPPLEILHE